MQKYETIFVIDSLLKSEEIDSIINKYERFLSANGGQIEAIERWGKKRLAYEIKKRQYGYYVLIRFAGPPTMIKPLEREYRLNESLLRYKTLVMSKRAIDALSEKENLAEPKTSQAPARDETKGKAVETTAGSEEKPAEDKDTATEPVPESVNEPTDAEPAEEEISVEKKEDE